MYKWHISPAIGRNRPTVKDLVRVTEGITVSLRQFSILLSTAEESKAPPALSRAQKSANATQEVSSLASSPKGVDARALASKVPSFTIKRVEWVDNPNRPRGRGGFRPQTPAGNTRAATGPNRLNASRGRGGARGGGRGRASRGRGGRTKGSRTRNVPAGMADLIEPPLNAAEQEYLDGAIQGRHAPYLPTTTEDSLDRFRPGFATSTSPKAMAASVIYKMQVATGNLSYPPHSAAVHLENIKQGKETLFYSEQDRADTEEYLNKKQRAVAEKLGKRYIPATIGILSESDRESIGQAWVAGHHTKPKATDQADTIGVVQSLTTRNGTYREPISEKLQAVIGSLIPSQESLSKAKKATK